jgi:Na+/glutamate symporter
MFREVFGGIQEKATMKFSIREWRPAHLFGAWVSYWVILAGVTLARPLRLLGQLRGGEQHGTASAQFDNALFSAHFEVGGQVWDMSAHLGTICGWLAGPPLVIWAVYVATRPSQRAMLAAPAPAPAPAPALDATSARELGAGDVRGQGAGAEIRVRTRARVK